MSDIKNSSDFLQGQADCRDGVEHKAGRSEDYDRGYSAQYELEQVVTWVSERGLHGKH